MLTNTDSRHSVHIELLPPNWDPDHPLRSYTPGCVDTCAVIAPPGVYLLLTRDPEGQRVLERPTTLRLQEDARYDIRPPSTARNRRWLASAITSTASLIAGFAVMNIAMEADDDNVAGAASFVILGGMVMTPVSWSNYARSRRPIVRMRPLSGPRSLPP